MDAKLKASAAADVDQTENVIVSQWREFSADEQHHYRDRVDEIFRPIGYETSLVIIRRANSIALFFMCLTLSALMSLREQWRSGQLRQIVQSLFTFLSGSTQTIYIKRIIWLLNDYEQSLQFLRCVQGEQKRCNHELFESFLTVAGFHVKSILACV